MKKSAKETKNIYLPAGKMHLTDVMAVVLLTYIYDVNLFFWYIGDIPYNVSPIDAVQLTEVPKSDVPYFGRTEFVRPDRSKYSAAGLVWRELGRQILRSTQVPEEANEALWKAIDTRVMKPIDNFDGKFDHSEITIQDVLHTFTPIGKEKFIPNFWKAAGWVHEYFTRVAARKLQAMS